MLFFWVKRSEKKKKKKKKKKNKKNNNNKKYKKNNNNKQNKNTTTTTKKQKKNKKKNTTTTDFPRDVESRVGTKSNQPSRHMTFVQRPIKVDATSWRCIDVDATLSQRCVPAGKIRQLLDQVNKI